MSLSFFAIFLCIVSTLVVVLGALAYLSHRRNKRAEWDQNVNN